MSNLPDGITFAELQKLAKLNAQIAKAQIVQRALADKVKGLFKVGVYTFDSVIVELTAKTQLDVAVFEADKPSEAYPQYYKTTPDTKIIQKDFAKMYYIPSTPSLSVKLVS